MSGRPHACLVSAVAPARDVRTFHHVGRSLVDAGWRVTVIGRESGDPAMVDGVFVLPVGAGRGPARAAAQARAIRLAFASRADVYQVGDVDLLPAALLLRRAGRAVVYDSREDYPAYMLLKSWIPRRLRPLAARAVDRLERLAARHLDAVITADEGTAARLARYGGRVIVVHNFPRRGWAVPQPAASRRYDVVYHGSLPPYVLEALAAVARELARRVPEAGWTVVGRPDTRAAAAAFARDAAPLGPRLALRPRIGFEAVPSLLAGARTGVVPLPDMPKFRTNIPMKLFEFMAAGVPAVASDLPPARALLGDGGAALLVPPGDHAAFADALAELLRDPARAAAVARRGREAIEDRFHWERDEPALVRLYAALLGGPGLRPMAEESVA